ncbi:hypothetical protein D5S18_02515 [Nocardia panacis]|uniref:HTH cro/C1-type domain-containing protein n=1 Tax=Nocardia panacis TaxID=2340916 RepID=A0A3A4KVG2_9NOCA|nr:helix-turn-helix domain-containing protein [Nocardia panacis]RJO79230.1 hypothetical protein D5S18_02515 [Nocardia panacis]
MDSRHSLACGRDIARELATAGGSDWEAAQAIRARCGVSALRAHRMARGYTLTEVARRLQQVLTDRGIACSGLSHQSVSRWETGLDMPSYQFLDALCRLYRTRPDRLGFGSDYSGSDEPAPARRGLPSTAGATVRALEEGVERSGRLVYILPPSEYIPARIRELATVQQLLLGEHSAETQRRLRRVEALLAGFVAFRLNDVADMHDTFPWFYKSRRAARRAEDPALEAWLHGHLAHGHECYRHALDQGLAAARSAQTGDGDKASAARVFGLVVEAGIQARIGRRREALTALSAADRMFEALPPRATAEDNIGTSEYILRWHQSHALSSIGEWRAAEEIRGRVLELPMAHRDQVGRALLDLDMAALLERRGELDRAATLIRQVWHRLPTELRVGQVRRNVSQLVIALPNRVRENIFEH